MNIAIDVSPIQPDNAHKARGTGFYLEYLKKALLAINSTNEFTFFTQASELDANVDLVHYPYFEPFFQTLPLKKKYPTVVTVHDLTTIAFIKHFPPGIKGYMKWLLQRSSLQSCRAIITDSKASKRDIIKYAGIPAGKIHVVYLAA
jgi:hypothetical protein